MAKSKSQKRSAHYISLNNGGPRPLPETRPDILVRMQSEVNSHTGYLQTYSNGEFISRSLAVANTLENLQKVRTLDNPSNTAYWCSTNKLWWREGGCFD